MSESLSPTPPPDLSRLLTTREAAERLKVSPRRIRALIAEGRLPARKMGIGPNAMHIICEEDLARVQDRPNGRHLTPRRPKGAPTCAPS